MLTLFGTILVVYVMWLVVKPLLSRYIQRKFQQKVNNMFRQAMSGAPGQDPFDPSQRNNADRNRPERPAKRKIFSRDEGEYIEFEEIHIHTEYTATDTSSATKSGSSAYTPREPQVSDAVWEEIR